MSVLLFTESCEPGGSERVVEAIALFLRDQDIPVTVATLELGWLSDTLIRHQIPHVLIESPRLDFRLPSKIAKVARDNQHTVVHSHLLDSYFYGSLAGGLHGLKAIGTEHGDVHHTEKKKFTSLKLKITGMTPAHITAVSDFTRRQLIHLGLPEQSCSTLYNPVLLPAGYETFDQRSNILNEIGLSHEDNAFLWIHAASLFPVKNQKLLMDAFDRAYSENQHLLIIGTGPEYDALKSHQLQLQHSEQIHVLGFKDNIHEYYAASDAFILSSDSEAMPMSILEASAHKLPVVSTDVGGISEIMNEEKGYLVEAKNCEQLAAMIQHVYNHPEEARQKAENSHRYTMAEFSLAAIGQKLLHLYGLESN